MSTKVFRRLGAAFTVGLTVMLFSSTSVTAHPGMQHGGTTGHLPPVNRGVDLIGKLDLFANDEQPGRISDVGAFGNYAYLGVFASPNCEETGIYVIDISDPTAPVEVGFIPADEASFAGEGVQVLDMNIPDGFDGQVLIHSNETCLPQGNPVLGDDPRLGLGGPGGASLWNVTDPLNPELLASHVGDTDQPNPSGLPHNSHSSFGWQQGDKAYMLVVDNGEMPGTDIDIFDITDPANPELIRETGMDDWPASVLEDPPPNNETPMIHDFVVKQIGEKWYLLASYWDAGYVIVDVTNPAEPVFLGDSDFGLEPFQAELGIPNTWTAEGNGHQAEFNRDGSLFLAADEDFNAMRNLGTILTGQYAGDTFSAILGNETPNVSEEGLEGPAVWQGFGCAAMTPAPQNEDAYALTERGGCTFTVKVTNAEAAGYEAVIVFNDQLPSTTPCPGTANPAATGNIPLLSVSRATGLKLMDEDFTGDGCTTSTPSDQPGTVQETLSFDVGFDGWGYLHLYDAQAATGATATGTDPVKLEAIDHWALPESLDPTKAVGFGDLTIHEVATDPNANNIAYSSHYAGGYRVFQFDRTNGIREIGAFIDEGGNNLWGVEVIQHPTAGKIVLASDRDYGLYIFGAAPADLTPVKITTSDAPRRGRAITLASNIKNLGATDATQVVVQFFENGTQIGSDRIVSRIPAGGGKSATIQWRPRTLGLRTITVKVDPLDAIDEIDEANNTFERTYRVRPPK